MNARNRKLVGVLLAAILAGCGGERAEREPEERHGAGEIELFEKNKGVRLPPELQRELGLATAEVVERSVTPRLGKMAQVYRPAGGSSAAGAVTWLSDAESQAVRPGQRVQVKLSGSSNVVSTGTIVRLERSSKAGPDPVEALVEFNDPDGRFPMGCTLALAFPGAHPRAVLAVPESAVVYGAAGAFVYAANGEHFVRTPVKPGAAEDGWVEITDGLYAGDVVAARAVDSLWLIELCALKGGTPCCPVPTKKRDG